MIIFFLTPQNFAKITAKSAEYIPVAGPLIEYTRKSQKLTELSDPVSATSRGIGILFTTCFGKTAVISAEWVLWFGLSIAGGVTGNPALIG